MSNPSHPLSSKFTLTFTHRPPGKAGMVADYNENIKTLASFDTVQDFWSVYSHCKHPDELLPVTEYHLFRDDIKPVWEDEANENGGKWMVKLRKGLASRMWENLCLAVIGEQFGVGKELCGIVISVRAQEDIIAVWTRSAADRQVVLKIRDAMRKVLNLPANTEMEYKNHNRSLQDKVNFRNPDSVR